MTKSNLDGDNILYNGLDTHLPATWRNMPFRIVSTLKVGLRYLGTGAFQFLVEGSLKKSVENAGVAFVKGANERNEFPEKNKQTLIHYEQVQTNKAKD